jgi:hypothetical protein
MRSLAPVPATLTRRGLLPALAAALLAALLAVPIGLTAADQWIEVKTAHFTLMSNAGDRTTRKLAWQLEQMRGALTVL